MNSAAYLRHHNGWRSCQSLFFCHLDWWPWVEDVDHRDNLQWQFSCTFPSHIWGLKKAHIHQAWTAEGNFPPAPRSWLKQSPIYLWNHWNNFFNVVERFGNRYLARSFKPRVPSLFWSKIFIWRTGEENKWFTSFYFLRTPVWLVNQLSFNQFAGSTNFFQSEIISKENVLGKKNQYKTRMNNNIGGNIWTK